MKVVGKFCCTADKQEELGIQPLTGKLVALCSILWHEE